MTCVQLYVCGYSVLILRKLCAAEIILHVMSATITPTRVFWSLKMLSWYILVLFHARDSFAC